jgi:hypothetical protein
MSPETWVFWIYASNIARFEQSFREIADRLKISGRKNPKANIFKLVYDWFHDERKGRWVLILDNIDDDHFLYEILSISRTRSVRDDNHMFVQPLFKYLPLSAHGSIIITTRSRSVAAKIVEERDIITIKPMDQIHALTLFEKKLRKQENEEDIIELITALEFMPLVIVQAATYIKQRASRSSVKQYLQEFQKNDRRKISLLNYEGGQLHQDQEAKNSIILTWQISFDHMRQERPTAAELLSLMSFFDQQGIAGFLLQNLSESGNHLENMEECWEDEARDESGIVNEDNTSDEDENSAVESNVDNQFEDDIVTLRNLSFISIGTDGVSFQMHRLVQLATQKWLKAYGQHEKWKRHFIQNISREFPTGEYENWKKCELIFPHAQSAMTQWSVADDSLGEWASLLYNAAWFA